MIACDKQSALGETFCLEAVVFYIKMTCFLGLNRVRYLMFG